MQTTLKALPIAVLISAIYGCGGSTDKPSSTTAPQGTTSSTPTTTTPTTSASNYTAGNLLVSRTAYDPAFTLSGTLPYNATPTTTNAVKRQFAYIRPCAMALAPAQRSLSFDAPKSVASSETVAELAIERFALARARMRCSCA